MKETAKKLIAIIWLCAGATCIWGGEVAVVILCFLLLGNDALVNIFPFSTNSKNRQVKEKLPEEDIEPLEVIDIEVKIPEKIEKLNEVHIIEDEDIGCRYTVNQAFKPAKSHACEINLLCTYAPDEDYGHEGDFPCIGVADDREPYCAVEEYLATKTFEGAIFIEPLEGTFLFRAKRKYYSYMMYFYGFESKENDCYTYAGLCLYYPEEYVGTENEKILMEILDEAAQTFELDKLEIPLPPGFFPEQ